MKFPRPATLVPGWLMTAVWLAINGRSFIIMHTGRVGSVVLGELLAEHPRIRFDHDPLQRRRAEWVRRHGPHAPYGEDPRWELMRRPWRAGRGIYGVVIKPALFDDVAGWHAMLGYLDRTLRPKRVAITRRNLLRQIVSGCRALETAQWHLYERDVPVREKLHASPDRLPRLSGGTMTLLEALAEREAAAATVEAAARDAGAGGLHLVYEEHIERDPLVGYREVCRLIGVAPDADARPKLSRTGDRPLRELVDQPEQWADMLRGTGWAWMLEN